MRTGVFRIVVPAIAAVGLCASAAFSAPCPTQYTVSGNVEYFDGGVVPVPVAARITITGTDCGGNPVFVETCASAPTGFGFWSALIPASDPNGYTMTADRPGWRFIPNREAVTQPIIVDRNFQHINWEAFPAALAPECEVFNATTFGHDLDIIQVPDPQFQDPILDDEFEYAVFSQCFNAYLDPDKFFQPPSPQKNSRKETSPTAVWRKLSRWNLLCFIEARDPAPLGNCPNNGELCTNNCDWIAGVGFPTDECCYFVLQRIAVNPGFFCPNGGDNDIVSISEKCCITLCPILHNGPPICCDRQVSYLGVAVNNPYTCDNYVEYAIEICNPTYRMINKWAAIMTMYPPIIGDPNALAYGSRYYLKKDWLGSGIGGTWVPDVLADPNYFPTNHPLYCPVEYRMASDWYCACIANRGDPALVKELKGGYDGFKDYLCGPCVDGSIVCNDQNADGLGTGHLNATTPQSCPAPLEGQLIRTIPRTKRSYAVCDGTVIMEYPPLYLEPSDKTCCFYDPLGDMGRIVQDFGGIPPIQQGAIYGCFPSGVVEVEVTCGNTAQGGETPPTILIPVGTVCGCETDHTVGAFDVPWWAVALVSLSNYNVYWPCLHGNDRGDMDRNGVINVFDVPLLIRFLFCNVEPTDDQVEQFIDAVGAFQVGFQNGDPDAGPVLVNQIESIMNPPTPKVKKTKRGIGGPVMSGNH